MSGRVTLAGRGRGCGSVDKTQGAEQLWYGGAGGGDQPASVERGEGGVETKSLTTAANSYQDFSAISAVIKCR
jgi:hypothetical protein